MNGDYYEGGLRPSDTEPIREGKGRFLTSSEKYYEYNGEWKGNARHGKGACFYLNGGYFSGDWQNEKRHGTGTMIKSSGETYYGQWENDKKNGKGTLWSQSQTKFIGRFKNNRKEGKGKMYFPDGTMTSGIWIDDAQKNVKGLFK